jgi:uncharacterized phage protein gp47/JayE
MSYAPPAIGPAGLTIPSFQDILQYLLTNYQNIYGQSVSLDNSNADVQLLNILALAYADVMNALQLEYNNRSPNFAVGAALDSLVKLNGLARLVATASTCQLTLTGTSGSVITNGLVGDVNGNKWSLPPSVAIGSGGNVTVTAMCTVTGAINASANQIKFILTPSAGWLSVTNGFNLPIVGSPVETDSQLRARQAVSTELPSITLVAGTQAGLEAVAGVTRVFVEENPTGAVDANGCPPHSITAVVEGGTNLAVATAIYNNRGIGCLTNGTTSQSVIDPNTGVPFLVSFDRPTYVPIFVTVQVQLLAGGTSATEAAIAQAIVTYLQSLAIGAIVNYGGLISTVVSVNPNPLNPIFLVELLNFGIVVNPVTITDIQLLFNQAALGVLSNILVHT